LAAALVATGCSSGSGSDSEAEEMAATYRTGGGFPSPPDYPGNLDIEIYAGANTTSADCLIYDFVGPNVHDGQTGDLLVTVVGDAINDADGMTLCTRDGDELIERVHVGGTDGPVLFTSFGRWVFAGELDFEGDDFWQIVEELSDQLVFTFQGPHIYDGFVFSSEKVATATAPLTHANTTRKLVVAAMLSAECGGLGIVEEEPYKP
jgi:hypothetical protein